MDSRYHQLVGLVLLLVPSVASAQEKSDLEKAFDNCMANPLVVTLPRPGGNPVVIRSTNSHTPDGCDGPGGIIDQWTAQVIAKAAAMGQQK